MVLLLFCVSHRAPLSISLNVFFLYYRRCCCRLHCHCGLCVCTVLCMLFIFGVHFSWKLKWGIFTTLYFQRSALKTSAWFYWTVFEATNWQCQRFWYLWLLNFDYTYGSNHKHALARTHALTRIVRKQITTNKKRLDGVNDIESVRVYLWAEDEAETTTTKKTAEPVENLGEFGRCGYMRWCLYENEFTTYTL